MRADTPFCVGLSSLLQCPLLPLAASWAVLTHLPALASQSPWASLLSLVLASHLILLPRLFSNARNNEEKDTNTWRPLKAHYSQGCSKPLIFTRTPWNGHCSVLHFDHVGNWGADRLRGLPVTAQLIRAERGFHAECLSPGRLSSQGPGGHPEWRLLPSSHHFLVNSTLLTNSITVQRPRMLQTQTGLGFSGSIFLSEASYTGRWWRRAHLLESHLETHQKHPIRDSPCDPGKMILNF